MSAKLAEMIAERGGLLPGVKLERELRAIAAAPLPRDLTRVAALLCATPDAQLNAALREEIERRAEAYEADIGDAGKTGERVRNLRRELADLGLRGFLVPMADEYQNEYVPQRAKRITWLTGFTGSAGLVAVLNDAAAIFTDGRYTLQVRDQVNPEIFDTRHITEQPATDWLAEKLRPGDKLGYDPWLFSTTGIAKFEAALEQAGAELVAVESNPLDRVWQSQPPAPVARIEPYEMKFAGEASNSKRDRLATGLREAKSDAAVITAPESIAWLLNIRGGDVGHTPLPLSFAILKGDGHCDFFVDRRKVTPGLEQHLGNQVTIRSQDEFISALSDLAGADHRVQVDKNTVADAVFRRLQAGSAEIVDLPDPCRLPKACKNEVELAGIRAAHHRDGVAETRFLHWLATAAEDGKVDELQAAEQLSGYRAEGVHFRDLSFDTISGAGANGAIVHYRVTAETNRRLEPGSLYLVDSGAQYLDGTTDITRTIAIGEPSAEMRDRFTRVLKGHIAIARAVFPEGTSGGVLDILARNELWRAGLDYDHGTGHGVGCYLGVHEGPQGISRHFSQVALEAGMIVSNEPGYYKTGAYGIRIENLVAVRPAEDIDGGERKMLSFETLTLAPIDLNLVDGEMLWAAERDWLNSYHARVREALKPELEPDVAAWLKEATRPV